MTSSGQLTTAVKMWVFIVVVASLVLAALVILNWVQMIFWKQSPTPGMPFPIVGHSYQFMVPQEDIWSTAESIIAKCDKQQRKAS